jgi:hypothetical protein
LQEYFADRRASRLKTSEKAFWFANTMQNIFAGDEFRFPDI